jgi:hypothetical protein
MAKRRSWTVHFGERRCAHLNSGEVDPFAVAYRPAADDLREARRCPFTPPHHLLGGERESPPRLERAAAVLKCAEADFWSLQIDQNRGVRSGFARRSAGSRRAGRASTPAQSNCRMVSSESLAGPIVATILVFAILDECGWGFGSLAVAVVNASSHKKNL